MLTAEITAPCGCRLAPYGPARALKSIAKCRAHWALYQDPLRAGPAYYRDCGTLSDSNLPRRDTPHVAELIEALGDLPTVAGPCLELGCGISPYVEHLTSRAEGYIGVDVCHWAIATMRRTYPSAEFLHYDIAAHGLPDIPCGMLFAAHVLEHLPNAMQVVMSIGQVLRPEGYAVIIVPDATDLLNPDHVWFFTIDTLAATLRRAGLEVLRLVSRKRIARENFLYALARHD